MNQKTKTEIIKVAVILAIAIAVRLVRSRMGWRPAWNSSLWQNNRLLLSALLWLVFGVYWFIAGLNSAPTKNSESRVSTWFHQFLLAAAFLLAVLPIPGLTGWFLPSSLHFVVATGAIVQAGFMLLAVWARRHLGRNWSAEVRIAVDHQLVRTGPYRFLRHPIYTAMLGMLLGTAIASSQYHALLGLALLVVAYMRKTRLEDQILHQTFGTDFESYRRDTWALVPLVY